MTAPSRRAGSDIVCWNAAIGFVASNSVPDSFSMTASGSGENAETLVDRYVSIVLDGLRAPGREQLPGRPLTIAEVEQLLDGGCGA